MLIIALIELKLNDPFSMAAVTRGCLERLDTKSMSQFLEQVADSKDGDASRNYAISLFSELARVHKQKLIPFIPRIMDSVLRSLSSTGSSSQQLQQACAKVVASIARYTIDPTKPLEANQDILWGVCSPLLSALSSNVEPLASGAVVCLQVLVESEKWKWASSDLQETVCAKAMKALAIEGNQTVVHMNLMRSLVKFNNNAVREHVGKLLKIGTDVLQSTMHTPMTWQQRVSAAQLIGTVLKMGNAQLAHLDLNHTLQILEDCQFDEVIGVRSAVAKALEAAKHKELKNGSHDKSGVDYVLISSKPEDSDLLDSQSFKSNTSSADTSQRSSLSTECSPCVPAMESARNASVETKGNFKLSRRKESLPAVKPRRALSDLPFSSQPVVSQHNGDLRDFPDAQNSPCHNVSAVKIISNANGAFTGSKSLRGFFPDAENAEKVFFPFKSEQSKKSSNVSGEAGTEGFILTQEKASHRKDQEKSGRESHSRMDHSLRGGFALPNEGAARGAPVSCATDVIREGIASSEEYNIGKIQSRYADMPSRMTDDPLCNGCMDLPSTPDTSKMGLCSDLTTPTHSKIDLLFSKTMKSGVPLPNGAMFTSPRGLVQALQGTDCSSSVTSKGASSVDYDKDCLTGGMEMVRANGILEIGSHKKTVSDNSSCCTSEDGDEVGRGSPDVYRKQRRRWPRSGNGSSLKASLSPMESSPSSLVDQVQKPELRSRAAVHAPIRLHQLSPENLSSTETQKTVAMDVGASSKTSALHLAKPSCGGSMWIWALGMLIMGGILLSCLSEVHDPHVLVPT